jgi:hypothetical protein
MDFEDPEIPAWFWPVIDAAGHRLDVLEAWLTNQPKDVVVAYGQAYVRDSLRRSTGRRAGVLARRWVALLAHRSWARWSWVTSAATG